MQRRGYGFAPSDGPAGSRPAAGAMARRRRLTGRPVLMALLLGAAATGLLVQIIALANSVCGLRDEIARLGEDREFLRADVARLTTLWNEVTAPEVVIPRAREELGLRVPEGAATFVVMLEDARRGRSPAPRRFLATLPPAAVVAEGTEAEAGR